MANLLKMGLNFAGFARMCAQKTYHKIGEAQEKIGILIKYYYIEPVGSPSLNKPPAACILS